MQESHSGDDSSCIRLVTTSLCYLKPLRYLSLTTIAASVNYPDEYKGPEPRQNSRIWKEKKNIKEMRLQEMKAGVENEK
jgi:hypothetical protein